MIRILDLTNTVLPAEQCFQATQMHLLYKFRVKERLFQSWGSYDEKLPLA